MCVNMEKSCPGDTWSCGNYHEGGFEYFGPCLWIDFVMAIETVQNEALKLHRCVTEIQLKSRSVEGVSRQLSEFAVGLISSQSRL